MTEKFHELYQAISLVKTEIDYDLMFAAIVAEQQEGDITEKDRQVLHNCLEAFAKAMEII